LNNWNPEAVPGIGANISFNSINNGKTNSQVNGTFSLGSITFQGAPNKASAYTINTHTIFSSLTLTGVGVIRW
jgi:hypothetical protein